MDTLLIFTGTAACRVGAPLVTTLLRRAGVTQNGNTSERLIEMANLDVFALDMDATNPMRAYPEACGSLPTIPFSAIKTEPTRYPAAADIDTMLLPDDAANLLGGNGHPAVGNLTARLAQEAIKEYLWWRCTKLSAQGTIIVVASPSSTVGPGMTLEVLCLVHETLRALGKSSVAKILVILSNQHLTMDPQRRLREAAFISTLNALEQGGVMARPHTAGREHRGALCDLVFFVSAAYSPGLSPGSMNQGPRSIGHTVEDLLGYEVCYLEYCLASPVGAKIQANRIRIPLPRHGMRGQPPLLSFHGFSALDARVDAVCRCAERTLALNVLDTLRGTGEKPAVLLAPPPPLSLAEYLLQRFVASYQEAVRSILQEVKALLAEKSKAPKDWYAPIQGAFARVETLLQQAERDAPSVREALCRELEQHIRSEITLNNINAGSNATRKGLDHLRHALMEAHRELPMLLHPPLAQCKDDILEQCRGTLSRDRKRKRVSGLMDKICGAADQQVYPEAQHCIEALFGGVDRVSMGVSVDAELEQTQRLCRQELQALVDVKERYPVRFAFPGSQLAYYSAPYVSTSAVEEVRKAFWREWQPTDTAEELYRHVLALIRAKQYVLIDPDQLFDMIYQEVYRSPSDRQQLLDTLFAECRLAGEGLSPEFRAQHGPLAEVVTICCPPGAKADLDAYLAKNMPNQDGITLHVIPGLGQIVLHREGHRCPAFAQHHLQVLGEEYETVADKTPYVIARWAAQVGSYLPREPYMPFQGFSAEELLWAGVCLGEFDPADIAYPHPELVETRVPLGPLTSAVHQMADDGHRQPIVQLLTNRLSGFSTPTEISNRFNTIIKQRAAAGEPIEDVAPLYRKVLEEYTHLHNNGFGSRA